MSISLSRSSLLLSCRNDAVTRAKRRAIIGTDIAVVILSLAWVATAFCCAVRASFWSELKDASEPVCWSRELYFDTMLTTFAPAASAARRASNASSAGLEGETCPAIWSIQIGDEKRIRIETMTTRLIATGRITGSTDSLQTLLL